MNLSAEIKLVEESDGAIPFCICYDQIRSSIHFGLDALEPLKKALVGSECYILVEPSVNPPVVVFRKDGGGWQNGQNDLGWWVQCWLMKKHHAFPNLEDWIKKAEQNA